MERVCGGLFASVAEYSRLDVLFYQGILKECGCLQNNTVVFGDNAYYNTDRIMNERGVDMCSVAVKIPDEVLYDTKMTETEANAFAKRATALMLYTQNHISIGY